MIETMMKLEDNGTLVMIEWLLAMITSCPKSNLLLPSPKGSTSLFWVDYLFVFGGRVAGHGCAETCLSIEPLVITYIT